MANEMDFLRQLDLVDPEKLAALEVTVIGAGGIGSPVVLALAKMGVRRITVYDDDVVEPHNLPNQWYRMGDVGRPKVEALRDIVHEYTGVEIDAHNERFEDQPVGGVVISGVDSMDTRIAIWNRAMKMNPRVELFIDGRMGGEQFYVYAVRPCDPDDIEWYEKLLYPSAEAAEIPCSARSIVYTLLSIAAEIAAIVKSFVQMNEAPRQIIRDMPTGVLEVNR